MAVRSGAGTGVIVSLIVFIVLTIAMLVMSIVFYSRQAEANESRQSAEDELRKYVAVTERSSDRFSRFEEAAGQSRESVASYLATRYDDLAVYVTGAEAADLDAIKSQLAPEGVEESRGIAGSIRAMRRNIRDLESEVDASDRRLSDRNRELAAAEDRIRELQDAHSAEKADLTREVAAYREANDRYTADLRSTREMMEERVEQQQADFEDRERDLNDELDLARTDLRRVQDRLEQYETLLEGQRLRAQDPSLLVDARVLDVDPANDNVFIDRGDTDRIVMGLTFEVFDSVESIRFDNGVVAPGKASIKVTQVNESTSTARVTRSTTGRPIVRGDVIVNAAYDPNRTFKFLVHGAFDVDRNGVATAAEAEFIRSMIINWGGTVVEGDEVPGDLDFLVLGVQPEKPAPLSGNPSRNQIQIWAERNQAVETYDALLNQATDAKIPVLNSNRFFILIGQG